MGAMAHVGTMIGAVVNLNHPTHYLTKGWSQISVPNLVVIVLMVAVFVGALLIPFPGSARRTDRDAMSDEGTEP
jgi:hypothetical protein